MPAIFARGTSSHGSPRVEIRCGCPATVHEIRCAQYHIVKASACFDAKTADGRGRGRRIKVRRLLRAATLASATLTISGIAHAADLGLPAPPPPVPPVYVAPVFTWTGFYIGGNLGVAWTKGDVTDSFGDVDFNYGQNAVFTGGGQVGANYQFNWLVVGVEADFDWLANNQNSSSAVSVPSLGSVQVSANERWITTLAARVGVANNNWLYYAKGGGGWVGVNNFTLTNVPTGNSISFSNSNSNIGWLVGAGIEWAFAPNWTGRIEYDFLGLNNQSFTVPAGAPFLAGDVISITNRDVQTLTVGVNYLFNWH
jgi:outer membrane immunogenic protein